MTNQPLFLRYNPAVEPVLQGATGSGVSLLLGDQLLHPELRQDAKPDQLHGRKEADGQQVCLQLGFIEETEANHTVYYSPVQQFCCICFIFQNS